MSNKKPVEAGQSKPAADTGRRHSETNSAGEFEGQRVGGMAARSRPQAALKKGASACADPDAAEVSTPTVLATKSAAAPSVPSTHAHGQKQVAVVPKEVNSKSVSFGGATMTYASSASLHRTRAGLKNAARVSAVTTAPRQFGLDSMASLHIVGNKLCSSQGCARARRSHVPWPTEQVCRSCRLAVWS